MRTLEDQHNKSIRALDAALPRRRRTRRVRQISARYPVGHRNSGRTSAEIENFFNLEQQTDLLSVKDNSTYNDTRKEMEGNGKGDSFPSFSSSGSETNSRINNGHNHALTKTHHGTKLQHRSTGILTKNIAVTPAA